MSHIYTSVDQLIGHTPLLELTHIEKEYSLPARLIAKVESFNPAGSVKDRVALSMIETAEAEGKLKPGSVIIEPTSGNTGIGLAMVGVARGYRVIIVMPSTMSLERQKLIKAYGAELVLTDGALGMSGAIEKANELVKEYPSSFIPSQFENQSNPRAHELTTGPEIWNDTDGKVNILVAGIGTGGTLSGTGKYLKEKNPEIKVIGVEPLNSPLLTKGVAGSHAIQGIGANFIPENLNRDIYDEVIDVSNEDAFFFARKMSQKEGIAVGISSGAALFGAIELAKRPENKGKNIVVVLTDTGERYLSTGLYK